MPYTYDLNYDYFYVCQMKQSLNSDILYCNIDRNLKFTLNFDILFLKKYKQISLSPISKKKSYNHVRDKNFQLLNFSYQNSLFSHNFDNFILLVSKVFQWHTYLPFIFIFIFQKRMLGNKNNYDTNLLLLLIYITTRSEKKETMSWWY